MTMLERLDKIIQMRSETDLRSWIADIQENEIDQRFYSKFEKILIEKWHHEHEDIVGIIWLFRLKDNRFIEPLLTIAQQPEVYRPFDDEPESTLRKCVRALKEIGTKESDLAIKKLIETGNATVKYAWKIIMKLDNLPGSLIEPNLIRVGIHNLLTYSIKLLQGFNNLSVRSTEFQIALNRIKCR